MSTKIAFKIVVPVSYTHLDVYKRQTLIGVSGQKPFRKRTKMQRTLLSSNKKKTSLADCSTDRSVSEEKSPQ